MFAVFLLIAGACSRSVEPETEPSMTPDLQDEGVSAFIPRSIIVQFDEELAEKLVQAAPGTKSEELVPALEGMGVISMERLFPEAGKWEARHRKAGLHCWYRLTVGTKTHPVTKASDFSGIPGVVFAEPERQVRSTSYFNDP